MTPCRLIVDGPQDGGWNMAVDEALLDDAATRGAASLRFYQWREPTLSLGYFQRYDERRSHAASRGASVVRRLSGGGALVHDRELTYSLCLPANHSLAGDWPALYATVHRAIIAALTSWGLTPNLHSDAPIGDKPTTPADDPFLCFARRSATDIMLATRQPSEPSVKIVGSSQRRRGRAVLQHGAILLECSPTAPELPGIREAAGVSIKPAELAERCSAELAKALRIGLSRSMAEPVLAKAQRLCGDKYAQASWTERR